MFIVVDMYYLSMSVKLLQCFFEHIAYLLKFVKNASELITKIPVNLIISKSWLKAF